MEKGKRRWAERIAATLDGMERTTFFSLVAILLSLGTLALSTTTTRVTRLLELSGSRGAVNEANAPIAYLAVIDSSAVVTPTPGRWTVTIDATEDGDEYQQALCSMSMPAHRPRLRFVNRPSGDVTDCDHSNASRLTMPTDTAMSAALLRTAVLVVEDGGRVVYSRERRPPARHVAEVLRVLGESPR